MSSEKPFADKKRRKVIDKIMRADYAMEGPIWDDISDEGKDFVNNLLIVDPKQRLNATGALAHPWLEHCNQHSDRAPSEAILSKLEHSFLSYKDTPTLKKLALNVIAHNSRTEEIVKLRDVFKKYDTEKNGVLSFDEFKAALHESDFSHELLREVFESVDINHNGHIMYTEFLAGKSAAVHLSFCNQLIEIPIPHVVFFDATATIETHGYIEEERVATAFDRLDSDDSGKQLAKCALHFI